MNRGRIWLSWVAVFLSGAVLGGVLTAAAFKRAVVRQLQGGAPAARAAVVKALKRELRLTPEQVPAVDQAIAAAHAELQVIRGRTRPEVEAVLERTVSEIKPGLTAEQQAKLDQVHARVRSRWAANP